MIQHDIVNWPINFRRLGIVTGRHTRGRRIDTFLDETLVDVTAV